MASRPSDWSALGLSDDPTPGDSDELQQVLDYLNQVAQATGTIETALQKVLGTATAGNFVGATSKAMSDQISGRFINFMRDCSNAFATAHTAVNTYHAAMLSQQQIAGDALSKAHSSGLKSDDPQVQAWAQQATQAGTDLTTASNTAASAVDTVSSGTQPISGWDMFWEALGWIALILLIPAIIIGGPLALIAFGLNLVLFIKAAVDFGEGKIGFGQFLLAFLGIIAPTTEGLNLAELLPSLIRGIGDAAKTGVTVIKGTLGDLIKLSKGFNFADIFTVDTLLAIGRFTYTAGVWVMHGIQDLPSLIASGALVTGKALGDFLGKVGTGIVHDLQTGAWVKLVLPLKGDEVANLGLGGAFRLGVLERGLGVSADPVLALKMVAVNGIRATGTDGLKFWSLSSETHFAANPAHGGLITPLGGHLAHPDISLNLHADPGIQPNSSLTTVHTTLTTGPTLITPAGHVMTADAMHGFSGQSMQVVTTHVAHGFTGDLSHGLAAPAAGTHLTAMGNLDHSFGAMGITGAHNLGNLSHVNTFTPTVTKLDLGGITSFSHTAQGHAGSVLDLRTPTEINNVFHGGAVVTHLDDSSIVIRGMAAPTVFSGVEHVVPEVQHFAPNVQHIVPEVQHIVPGMQHIVPEVRPVSANLGHVSTNVDHVSTPGSSGFEHVSSSESISGFEHVSGFEHDDAGVPGLLGLPGERVAVPWTDFKAAQHDYGHALDQFNAVHPRPDANGAESSAMGAAHGKGKATETAAQADATANLHVAAGNLNNAADALRMLDISPERLQALEHAALTQSVIDRPRLPGGSRPGDTVSRADADGNPLASTRPVGPNHQLNIDLSRGPNHETATLVTVQNNAEVYSGRLTELGPSGGFRLDHANNATWHQYAADGRLSHEGLPVHNPGAANPVHLTVDHTDALATATYQGGDGTRWTFAHNAVGFRLGHPTVGDGRWRQFDGGGNLVGQDIHITDHAGGNVGHLQINYGARPEALDVGGDGTRWNYVPDANGGGFRLNHPGPFNGSWRQFDGNGALTGSDLRVQDPSRINPDHLVIDHPNGHAVYQGGDGTQWDYVPDANGAGFRLNHPTAGDGRWQTFDGTGRLTGEDIHVTPPGAANPAHLVLDHTGVHPAATYAAGDPTRWTFARDPMGGFQLGHPTVGDGRWQHFDGAGNLVRQDVHITDQAGGNLSHVEIHYGAPDRAIDVGGDGTHWGYAANANGFRLTHPNDGTWRQFDVNGLLIGRNVAGVNHDATALGHVEVDYRNGHAFTPTGPGGGRVQWDYAHDPNTGGFDLTHANSHDRLTFDPNYRLVAQHVDLHDLAGGLNGTHIQADFTNPAAINLTAHDGGGAALAHLDVTRDGNGHYLVTDTTAGVVHGDFTEYGRFDGAVRGQGTNLGDHLGTHVYTDFTGAAPVRNLRGNGTNTVIGHFNVREVGGNFHVTDTRAGHVGNERVYDGGTGAPLSEQINVLRPNGRPTGQVLRVDYRANGGPRWTRNDAAGAAVTAHEPRLPSAYNSGGAAVPKHDGSLQLTGADKTPFYSREPLGNGHDLELFRGENGTRSWHEFDGAGRVGGGVRHYSTEADGVTSWDLGTWGQVIREYQVTADGGIVRAERGANGFTWARFNADGDKLLQGRRDNGLTGWTDTYSANGRTQVVQQKWNTLNWLPHAKHYREHGLNVGANGVVEVKTSFKEFSPQAKDTGSMESLTNGHTVTFTRYAEQRPPDFLWKSPQSLESPVSNALSRPFGSKWGAVDFPHEGVVLGDSRFQVFKWVEHDPAGHAVTSEGVRTVTPDGSVSDFAGDGAFVRGTIKLDNGHTVEIGRDANGKWDTFQLDATGGVPAQRTLNWRQLDSQKNVVAHGTRNFDGKHWADTFTDTTGAQPVERVVRHTELNGDVVHYTGNTKPTYRPTNPLGGRIEDPAAHLSVTRNTMGQIVRRNDHWGDIAGAGGGAHANPIRVNGHGDERVGRWDWRGSDGSTGIRINSRNTRWTGAWDDSYQDFRANPATNVTEQIRDFRALDKGKGLKAEPDGAGNWRSQKFDEGGNPVAGTDAARQWKQHDGTFGNARPPGRRPLDWRDVNANGVTVRELRDGRVREYTNVNDAGVWKEYDVNGVWRERTETSPGIYLEKEGFQKQWRVTDVHGNLLRYRGASGRIWERNPLGRWYLGDSWKQVGAEVESKGWMTDLRGANRRIREPNRREFVVGDGTAGTFRGTPYMLGQKVLTDFIQDFTLDVAANIVITGAVNNWNFSAADWGKIFTGGALKGGIRAGYGVMSETVLKGTRDGLRNVDGGKDWNRNPYNHDKFVDNEWKGNENPTRWRGGTYDYWVGTVAVGALGNFVSNAVTSAAFGLGPDHIKATGAEALKDGAIGMAGSLLDTLTVGAARTLAHQMSSGRFFHNGGLADITLQFGEKLLEKYLQDVLLNPAAHVKPEPPPVVPVAPAPGSSSP